MGTFRVHVENSIGESQKGISVAVNYGMFHGMDQKYTDGGGWAEFSNIDGKFVSGEIFIGSKSYGQRSTATGAVHRFKI